MKRTLLILVVFTITANAFGQQVTTPARVISDSIPSLLRGSFTDDYDIRYAINDTLWIQYPNTKYHIISWDTGAKYLLAQNDANNSADAGLYTRIDYLPFSNMEPYRWGFCLTTYNAATIEEAKTKATTDKTNPKKGCNGYPFSRMKKTK